MNIGQAIKKVRQEKGVSQKELAEKIMISATSLSQIETGVKQPSKKTLHKLCMTLQIPETILYIYALEEKDIPPSKKDIFNVMYPTLENILKGFY